MAVATQSPITDPPRGTPARRAGRLSRWRYRVSVLRHEPTVHDRRGAHRRPALPRRRAPARRPVRLGPGPVRRRVQVRHGRPARSPATTSGGCSAPRSAGSCSGNRWCTPWSSPSASPCSPCCSAARMAWLLTRTDVAGRKWLSTALVVPYMLPSWTFALAWLALFKNDASGGQIGMLEARGVHTPNWLAYGPCRSSSASACTTTRSCCCCSATRCAGSTRSWRTPPASSAPAGAPCMGRITLPLMLPVAVLLRAAGLRPHPRHVRHARTSWACRSTTTCCPPRCTRRPQPRARRHRRADRGVIVVIGVLVDHRRHPAGTRAADGSSPSAARARWTGSPARPLARAGRSASA